MDKLDSVIHVIQHIRHFVSDKLLLVCVNLPLRNTKQLITLLKDSSEVETYINVDFSLTNYSIYTLEVA